MNLMTTPAAMRLTIVLAVATLAIILAPSPHASSGAGYSIAMGSATGAPGGQFAVTLSSVSPEAGLGSLAVDISYNTNRFTVVSCRTTFAGCNKDFSPGLIRVAGVAFTPIVGERGLADIVFQARETAPLGTSTLDIEAAYVFSGAGVEVTSITSLTDGALTIVESAPVIKPGDANCDGHVNELDGLAILHQVSDSETNACSVYGDYNCDNVVDLKDAIAILEGLAAVDGPTPTC